MSATECVNVTFCVLVYRSPLETLLILEEEHGKVTRKTTVVNKWHKNIHEGRVSVNDNPCCVDVNFKNYKKGKYVHNAVQK
jgi:hypothetical protein